MIMTHTLFQNIGVVWLPQKPSILFKPPPKNPGYISVDIRSFMISMVNYPSNILSNCLDFDQQTLSTKLKMVVEREK